MANSGEAENKMQFVSANYSDLEGDLGKPARLGGAAPTVTATSRPLSGPSSSANLGGANSSTSTSIPMYSADAADRINTLDEPVSVTISRDLKAVGYKFGHVFFPKQSTLLLRDWDLWGPLSLCVLLSVSLEGNKEIDTKAPEFAGVFALIAFGAVVVTLNTKLLSGKISFFQSICVLGYCLLPLVMVSYLNNILFYFASPSSVFAFILRVALTMASCGWAVFSSTAFLAADTINLTDRKALAVFPIFLFYFVISWLIILHT